MEDEILKRNTDCVYFLASPLTCKKGIECEYRHSESARLNPRDCWYWLAGNCLNPTCAFRHPPLDGCMETLSEPAPLPHQASVPVNKTGVPCYFYFNGFCNKGERCSFLHGPNGVSPTQKSSKTASAVTDVHPQENKTLTGSDTVHVSIEAPPIPSEPTSKAVVSVRSQPKVDIQQSIPNNVVEQSPSPETSVPEGEDTAVKSDSLLPTEDFIESRSLLCRDQSSVEQVDDEIEPEERWESSPGFDVLVDDGSDNLGYEDDPEYLLVHDQEARELHNHLLQYDYEDPVGYDTMEYPDAEILYKEGLYDSYDCLENDHIIDYARRVPEHLRERMLDPMLLQKRKYLPRELDVNQRNGVDLRDRLRKRRRNDDCQVSHNPRRRDSAYLHDRSREPSGRRGVSHQPHKRFASEIGKNMIGSHSENESGSNNSNRRGWLRHSQKRPRHQEKERRRQARPQFPPSEVSRGLPSRKTRRPVIQESTVFTAPKTLAQIKEEKRKARGKDDAYGNTRYPCKTTSDDFQGPKPLSEILKGKGRMASVEYSTSRSKHDHVEPEGNHDHIYKDEKYFEDEDDEDDEDEGLDKKLARIFS